MARARSPRINVVLLSQLMARSIEQLAASGERLQDRLLVSLLRSVEQLEAALSERPWQAQVLARLEVRLLELAWRVQAKRDLRS